MLYLVRHGQTEFNAIGRWQGQSDSPLTRLGREQAITVAAILRREIADAGATIFSSPLGRAAETAAIIADALRITQPVIFDDRLKEVRMGSWDGLTSAEIEDGWPNARNGLGANEWFFHSPDGESYDEMLARVTAVLESLLCDDIGPKIVVCHGVTGRIMRGISSGLERGAELSLDVPQDAAFRLSGTGVVERLDI